MYRGLEKWLLPVLGCGLLSACASTIPKDIREAPADSPLLAEVRVDPERFAGSRIRWGGTIAAVENRAAETWLEVVARELRDDGRLRDGDHSPGRFIALVDGFLDPVVYTKGREITVVGIVQGETTRRIGGYDYAFPMVRVSNHILWQPLPEAPPHYYRPYWYYDPWYPYYYPYPHPWRYPPYWW